MAIRYLLVEKCCFFLPLASGVKFVGFLSLSGCLLLFIFGSLDLSLFIDLLREENLYTGCIEDFSTAGFILSTVVDLLVQVIQGTSAFFLLLGVYQRKSKLMRYWLFTTPIACLLEMSVLGNVFYHFMYTMILPFEWFILNIITIINDVYGWIVVYSYYHSLLTPGPAVI